MKKIKSKLRKQIKKSKNKKSSRSPRVHYDNDRKMSGTVGSLVFSYDPENALDFLNEQILLARR